MSDDYHELRLVHSAEGMAKIVKYIDKMKLGEMPEYMAVFLARCSDAQNWINLTEEREV